MVLKKNNIINKKNFNCNFFYKKLLGLLIKDGLKSKTKQCLDTVLFNVSKKLNSSPKIVLLNIFLKLNTFIETKRIKLRKRIVFVPCYANHSRRLFLMSKWLLLAIKSNKRKLSFTTKFTFEILALLTSNKSKSILFKRLNLKQALKSRANAHYRW